GDEDLLRGGGEVELRLGVAGAPGRLEQLRVLQQQRRGRPARGQRRVVGQRRVEPAPGGGDLRAALHQRQVARVGDDAGGEVLLGGVQVAGLERQLAELVTAERDVGRVERDLERLLHEPGRLVGAAVQLQVVGGTG